MFLRVDLRSSGLTPTALVSPAPSAIDGLADDVRVTSVASGLLDHVHRNPTKVLVRQVTARTHSIEIEVAQDLVRRGDRSAVVGNGRFDGVVVGELERRVDVVARHLGPLVRQAASSNDDLEPPALPDPGVLDQAEK